MSMTAISGDFGKSAGGGGTLLQGATIWSGLDAVPRFGWMHCVDGLIAGVGAGNSVPPRAMSSRMLRGCHVLPGLADCHRHFGLLALSPRLGNAQSWTSAGDALEAVADRARKSSDPGEWVVFANFDYSSWSDPRPPGRQELDHAGGGRPVFLVDVSLHRGVMSTRAMALAGLDALDWTGSDDLPRDRKGEPTGLVWEKAFGMALFSMFSDVEQRIGESEMDELMQQEAARCLALGLVHVHDAGAGRAHQERLSRLQDSSPIGITWSIANEEGLLTAPVRRDGLDAIWPRHGPRAVKLYLDGGNRCAICLPLGVLARATLKAAGKSILRRNISPFRPMLEQRVQLRGGHAHLPYLRFPTSQALLDTATLFDDMGCRLQIHALGNTAVRQALEVVRTLKPSLGASLEHIMFLGPSDFEAFDGVDVVASLQPGFIPRYADAIEAQGVVPSLHAFPLGSLVRRNVSVALSSDAPCGNGDPLHNIRCAVNRQTYDGRTVDDREAIDISTAVAAAAFGTRRAIGLRPSPLLPGERATFTLLDGHPMDPASRVIETWIDGKCVWSASNPNSRAAVSRAASGSSPSPAPRPTILRL